MADVTPPPVPGSVAAQGGNDRGQLMLVGAFALAVLFVSLALLLNAAIYTNNLATRDTGADTNQIVEYRSASVDTTDRLIGAANRHNNSSYADVRGTVSDAVDVWSDGVATHRAAGGGSASAETAAVVEGSTIAQPAERNFTNRSGTANWTLLAGTGGVRSYRMNVSRSSLASQSLIGVVDDFFGENVYGVRFDDGAGGNYTVYLTSTGADEVNVSTVAGNGTLVGGCDVSAAADGSLRINLSAGSVGGTSCDGLSALGSLGSTYDVRYLDADRVSGTYRLVSETGFGSLDSSHYHMDGGGQPAAYRAVYAADVQVTYRTSDAYYRETVRVVPDREVHGG